MGAVIPAAVLGSLAGICLLFIVWWFPRTFTKGVRYDQAEHDLAGRAAGSNGANFDRAAWRRRLLANTDVGRQLEANPGMIIGAKSSGGGASVETGSVVEGGAADGTGQGAQGRDAARGVVAKAEERNEEVGEEGRNREQQDLRKTEDRTDTGKDETRTTSVEDRMETGMAGSGGGGGGAAAEGTTTTTTPTVKL